MTNETGDRGSERRGRRARRPGERRSLAAGVVVSALAHLLLLVLYPYFTAPYPRGLPGAAPPPTAPAPDGIQVLRIIEVATPDPVEPADPVDIEPPDDPVALVEAPDFEAEVPVRFRRYESAAERLRPGRGDPRFWQPLDPEVAVPAAEHVLETMLALAIRARNDSLAAALEAARASTDWTVTDADGGTWGVSPGKLHLGGVTIPLPFGFAPPRDYNGDRAEMAFRLADIERAASTAIVRRTWKERREAMKRRREELRALKLRGKEKERGKIGAPPVVKPDTTSSRRRERR